MMEGRSNVGSGIVKTSARPTKVIVDGNGEWWICDAGIDSTKDLVGQGCVRHSEVHLVK
jgi:hypothetical protein